MRIAAVQTRPVPGDVPANLERHVRAIERSAAAGAHLAMFPELSLTGYEPTLAADLAMDPDDVRLDVLQRAGDDHGVAVAAGLPLAGSAGVRIGMALFRPGAPRSIFAKRYLHADEEAYFVPGAGGGALEVGGTRVAFAICYEIAVPEHPERAAADGAEVYLASVAKTPAGVAGAIGTLGDVAERLHLSVVMANCVGPSDGAVCGGRSSAWTPRAGLRAQLGPDVEGLVVLDTAAGSADALPFERPGA